MSERFEVASGIMWLIILSPILIPLLALLIGLTVIFSPIIILFWILSKLGDNNG